MVKKLLIANRGEIAVRIIRACREMGIETVAVYSSADKDNLHVKMADSAICIGPAPSAKSYLVIESLVTAALRTGCEAVHPGVGFLSENANFARAVLKAGLIFIGPDPSIIDLLGDKVEARSTAKRFGLPITPGTKDAVAGIEAAKEAVKLVGYPLIIKAASGGGGKGMRVVRKIEELNESLTLCEKEALANFADGRVFIERFVENPRHVELQIMADGRGKVSILGERDCSVQRNHQKLIEESPSPAVTKEMRDKMICGAQELFKNLECPSFASHENVRYCGAGTIEFLVEGKEFYFMEVNARVQVEHPVSELVSDTDIIRQQILACTEGRMEIADGSALIRGHAIECRINAKSPGMISRLEVPGGPGVRFDSFLYTGCNVPPFYDSMVAKLIVHAANREAAIKRMNRALGELVIEGIQTNRAQQLEIINHKIFKSGIFGTSFYEEEFGES
ncbi:acetyl-CoA carboxylase biotin carboxylase subunit [Spirochaetia bacterium]|nr:acetyl-CoA carboxylase biotin carboxylase subunit [Spirochaetia bacterium]